jgi:uncharacterized membrane protein (DUF485 family)
VRNGGISIVGETSSTRGDVMAANVPERERHDQVELESLAGRRLRVALLLTLGMLVVYFGFILLIAFNKSLLGEKLTDGLSLGILLGVIVVLTTWVLTWIYVWWANRHYEPVVRRLRR